MPRKGSKQPYKPRVEYKYTLRDIAELAGTTRNALNVAKVCGGSILEISRVSSAS